MAIQKGLYVATYKVLFDGTDVVVDLANDVIKGALFTNTLTPNFSTDTAYGSAPYTSNEITGTGYTAGGASLAGKTISESPTGTLMFDANDLAWSGATFTSARGLLVYDDTLATKRCLAMVDFTADYGVTAGTFTVQFASAGIYNIDVTP